MHNSTQPARGMFDENGLLADPASWSNELAEEIASLDGIDLTPSHWVIINELRRYYANFAAPPLQSRVCSINGMPHFCIHDLFSSCFEAWRIAGLPDPGEEAKAYMHNM